MKTTLSFLALCILINWTAAYPFDADVADEGDLAQAPLELDLLNDLRDYERRARPPIPTEHEENGEADEHSKDGRELEDVNMVKRETVTRYGPYDLVPMYNADGTSYKRHVKALSHWAHNRYRNQHQGTATLAWDDDLAEASADYAVELLDINPMVHSDTTGKYGENLYMGENNINAIFTPCHAINSWYGESKTPYTYNYQTTYFSETTGHFTQVVWLNSGSVGCGMATKDYLIQGYPILKTVVVCRYKNFGNVKNEFVQNVKPLKNGAPVFELFPWNELIPGKNGECVDTCVPADCQYYQGYGYCDAVRESCPCECP